jgi:DNA-binding MarR family transcriptional regulator
MSPSVDLDKDQWALWSGWMQAHRVLARELDRDLQSTCGISKAEFSVLVTLDRSPGKKLRVSELAEALDWDKGRVAHQLTRMERRGLVERVIGDTGTERRAGVRLTRDGRSTYRKALRGHAANVRRYFLETLTPEQHDTMHAWTQQILHLLGRADVDDAVR